MNTIARFGTFALAFSCACSAQRCFGAEFIPLGDLPDAAFRSFASDVSGDGRVVVGTGTSELSGGVSEAFRWTLETGIVGLGVHTNLIGERSIARAVSHEGNHIVGFGIPQTAGLTAFQWTPEGGMAPLDGASHGEIRSSAANAVSRSGRIVVGDLVFSNDPQLRPRAFVWTADVGFSLIGGLPESGGGGTAYAVSTDGRHVVGSGLGVNGVEAFLWSEDRGTQGLGDIPGGYFGSVAKAVSDSGSVVVGTGASEVSGGTGEAFRWTQATGMVPLGDLPGGSFSSDAHDVSADGRIIVGSSDGGDGNGAVIWRNGRPIESLRSLLVNEYGLGDSLAGWQLSTATAISADGRTIVGNGINPDGNHEAWLVRFDSAPVPEPKSVILAILGCTGIVIVSIIKRRLPCSTPRRVIVDTG